MTLDEQLREKTRQLALSIRGIFDAEENGEPTYPQIVNLLAAALAAARLEGINRAKDNIERLERYPYHTWERQQLVGLNDVRDALERAVVR